MGRLLFINKDHLNTEKLPQKKDPSKIEEVVKAEYKDNYHFEKGDVIFCYNDKSDTVSVYHLGTNNQSKNYNIYHYLESQTKWSVLKKLIEQDNKEIPIVVEKGETCKTIVETTFNNGFQINDYKVGLQDYNIKQFYGNCLGTINNIDSFVELNKKLQTLPRNKKQSPSVNGSSMLTIAKDDFYEIDIKFDGTDYKFDNQIKRCDFQSFRELLNDTYKDNIYIHIGWSESKGKEIFTLYIKTDLKEKVRQDVSSRRRDNSNVSLNENNSLSKETRHSTPSIEGEVANNKHILSTDYFPNIDDFQGRDLIYEKQLINRFGLALQTKPFVILTGLSGSGKTQLAINFSELYLRKAEITDAQNHICVIPVGADWTNREPLLGYRNALNPKEYKMENKVLELLIRAKTKTSEPFFLILDEMNLSVVERYFADFLSAMESQKEIPLWVKTAAGHGTKDNTSTATEEFDVETTVADEPIPESISLGKNVFIIGTVNVDETTYMFSPKVLDRAFVIEFSISNEEMDQFLEQKCKDNKHFISEWFQALKRINAEFGYRTAGEIDRYINNSKALSELDDNNAKDSAIISKMLPKLHGSELTLKPVLEEMLKLCLKDKTNAIEDLIEAQNEDTYKYPLSAKKIIRMYKNLKANGFTSFAEA